MASEDGDRFEQAGLKLLRKKVRIALDVWILAPSIR